MTMQGPQHDNYLSEIKSKLNLDKSTSEKDLIFDQIPLPACIIDLQTSRLVKANAAFENFLSHHQLTFDKIQFPIDRLLNGHRLVSEEMSIKSSDETVTVLLNSSAIQFADDLTTAIVYLHDVTYMKKIETNLKSAENKLSQTIKTSQIGFWHSDPGTGMTYICPTMAKNWGFQHLGNPVTADAIMNAIHQDDHPLIWGAVEQALLHGTPYHAEYRVIHPNGKTVWIESRGEYLKDHTGFPYRFSGTSTDITDRMLEKMKLMKDLAEQKAVVARLQQAQQHAEDANQNKTMFLANVSHEIRTPLSAILGFADLLKAGPFSEVEKNQFIETINRNGNALIKIIDDVLDMSKVEANCLEFEKIEFSLQQLLHDVTNQFKEKARAKNIYVLLDIQTELPHMILSDSVRIQQILSNLLSNAIKFTDQGGVILQVKSSMKKQSVANIEIKVIDTGIGLTEDQKNKLFQPFSQAENSTTRKFGGTGLGLALSKRIAEAMGGNLIIERCEKDVGCTFKLTLAVDAHTHSQKLIPTKKTKLQQMDFVPLAGFSILLAEDSLDNQFFIEKFLSKNGAHVVVVSNGYEVIEKCATHKFDIVLMDIDMPEMNGYEATRSLRQSGFTAPILALTAHAMAEERIKTRQAGCNGHITKPINTHQLLSTLEGHLRSSSSKKKRC